jgi:putative transposase
VREALPAASLRRVCRVLCVNRSRLIKPAKAVAQKPRDERDAPIVLRLRELAKQYPTFGYRRLWALLRYGDGLPVNRKRVHRLVKRLKLQVKRREVTPRPRVQQNKSKTQASDTRWAMDITHVYCGRDGWGHLSAVIDCHDREIVGIEFALRGGAKQAERALEAACLSRFGTLRPLGPTPTLRSDNGLIFTSRRFRAACSFYRLEQEFITPYTPEQNGLIERFFRSLKEECVWQHNFACFEEAKREIHRWIDWYNGERPHQALGYQSPSQYRQQQRLNVA